MGKRKYSETQGSGSFDNWSMESTIVLSDNELSKDEEMSFFPNGKDKALTEAVNIFLNGRLFEKTTLHCQHKGTCFWYNSRHLTFQK